MISVATARITRTIILACVGVFLIVPISGFFGAIGSLHVVAIILPLWILGLIALLGALLSVIPATRIAGNLLGFIVTGIYAVASVLSLFFTPIPHPATILFSLVVAMSYLDGLSESIHHKYS